MPATVHVKNLSQQTSEAQIRDFFSFCGKISDLSVTPDSSAADSSQSAAVTFEKEAAARTALLLDNTQLGPAQVQVSLASSLDDLGAKVPQAESSTDVKDEHDITQEDKPRSRIMAEYLAQGYVISDKAIERALQLDQQHGISARFTTALKDFDSRFHLTERAQAVDKQLGVTDRAVLAWRGMHSYFDQAMGTPTGRRLRTFYETGNKQVMDVHNEARHLADLKSGKSGAGGSSETEKMGLHAVGEAGRTKCNCGADSSQCPCEPGKCACGDCPKNQDAKTVV